MKIKKRKKEMGEEYKVKELKRESHQILMTDLMKGRGRWQVSRKRQELRLTSRVPAWVTDE